MKTIGNNPKSKLVQKTIWLGSCLFLALLAQNAGAAFVAMTWDPQGTTGGTIVNPTSGGYTGSMSQTWENAVWSTSQTGSATPINWVDVSTGSNVVFAVQANGNTPAFTVTMNANHTVAGIFDGPETPDPCTVTISGTGTMTWPSGTGALDITSDTGDPGSITINVVMAGTGGIEGEGSGSIILNGANTYNGGFSIGGSGGVSFGNNAAFGTGTITWLVSGFIQPAVAGTAYTINNPMTHLAGGIETFSGNTGGTTFGGAWTLGAANTTVTIENISGTITVSGAIGGAGALIINHASTGWNLTGANTYTGNTAITAGTLTIGGSGKLGTGGTYAGNITNAGTFTYNSSASQTLTGTISGAGAVNQSAGMLILSSNIYTGTTTLSGGTAQCNHSESSGAYGPFGKSTSVGSIVLTGGTIQYTVANNQHDYSSRFSTGANQLYNIDVNGAAVTYATALASSGGVLTLSSTAGNGALNLTAANSYTGKTIVNGPTTLNLDLSSGLDTVLGTAPGSYVANQLQLNNATLETSAGNVLLSVNRGITLTGANTITNNGKDGIFPDIIAGTGSLTKTGANATVLSGANSFSGGFTILQGTVYFVNNNTAGSAGITLGPTIGLVTLHNTNTSVLITNNITVNAGGTKLIDMVSATGDTLTFSGLISGAGALNRGNGGGPGFVVLSGNNTGWSGGITNQQGGLIIGNQNALGTGTITLNPASASDPVNLQAGMAMTGASAVANAVNIASTNITFVIGGSTNLEFSGPVNLASITGCTTPTITVNNTASTIFSGVISGPADIGLTSAGTGTLTLNGTDTYTGNTTVSSGTLALGAAGSINSSPVISIGAGATFDVSSQATYTLSASTSLTAIGTSNSAATLNGGTTVNLGSQAISLTFAPTNSLGDTNQPALVVAQGALTLSGNTISVNNASATALGAGTYTLINVTGGTITGAPNTSVSVTGSGIAAGATASISVSGGSVVLVVVETPVFTVPNPSITYGTASVTLGGKLESVGGAYPTNGETITITMNGITQTTTINDSTGDFSLSSNSAAIPYNATPYPITYSYGGDTYLNPANNSSTALTVNQAILTVTATGVSKIYDGTTTATVNLSDNRLNSDVFTEGYSSAAFASPNPGTGIPVSVTGINISGGASANYTLASTTTTTAANITSPNETWNGGDVANSSNWSDSTNWVSVTAPDLVGDSLDFAGATGPMPVMDSSYTVYSLTFDSTAGPFVLTNAPGTILTVATVTNASTNVQTMTMAMTGPAGGSFVINDSGGFDLVVTGPISDSGGGLTALGSSNATTLSLTATNTYTGPTTVSSGNLEIDGAGQLGSGNYAGNLTNSATFTYASSAAQTLSGTISGTGGLNQNGAGTLTLSGTNTYTGNTAINDGTLALASTGSIADSSGLSIAGGGTFDVSSQAAYSFANTPLVASGDQPATINGASGGTVMETNAVSLAFDGTDPALSIAQGTLVLSNNAFTVNGTALATGAYTVVEQASGNITDLSGTYPAPGGTAIGAGTTGAITVSGADVLLTIQSNTTTTVSSSTGGTSTYGQPVNFLATVTSSDGGGSVQFAVDGTNFGAPDPLIAGVATSSSTNSLSGGLHSVSATYSGDALSTSSSNTLAGGQTVMPADQTISFGSLANQTYGMAPYSISATASSSLPVSFTVVSGPASVAGSTVTMTGAGMVSIQASQGGNGNYNAAPLVTNSFTVNQLAVVLSGLRPYDGTATATNTILTVANAVGVDDVNVSSGTGSATLASANVGPEAITSAGSLSLSGTTAANYTLTGVSGSVTIGPVPLSVTANPQSTAYGTLITLVGSTAFTPSGLQPGDTIGSVTLAVSGGYMSNTPIGTYTITPSAATGGTFNPANYNSITYVTNALTITPLPVVLTGTQVYNGTNIVTNSTLSVANVVGSDDVSVASGGTTMASVDVGTNALTLPGTLALGGTTSSNYTLSGASGSVIVTPLTVTLTGTRPYDGTATAAAAVLSITDVAGSDDVSLASGSATLAGSAAGPEAISDPSGLVLGGTTATNYTLTGASGSVTITTVALSITANPVTKTYGTAIILDPTAFTVGSGALVGSEMVTAVTMMATPAGTAATDPVGIDTITPSAATGTGGFLAANYNITYNTNSLTVNPLTVVLTGTRPYDGTATAAFGILTVSNVVGGDDVAPASGSVNLAGASVGSQAVASVGTLALGGVTAPNYTLMGATGTVTISNPFNPFSIISSSLDNTGTNLVVCWQSVPGVVYSVLTNTSLAPPQSWAASGAPITATNTTTCFTLPGGIVGGTNAFVVIKQ